jgi:hypothetical protein
MIRQTCASTTPLPVALSERDFDQDRGRAMTSLADDEIARRPYVSAGIGTMLAV